MRVLTGWTRGGRKRLLGGLIVLLAVGGWVGWAEWSVERNLHAAEAAADAGDIPRARRLLDACLTQRPGSGRVLFLAARAARRAGDARSARDLLDRAAAAGWPAEPVAWEEKLLAAQTGRFAEHHAELRKVAEAAPDGPDADLLREVLVPGYLLRYELPVALGLAQAWADRRPADPRPWRWVYEAARAGSAVDRAEVAVRRWAALAPDDPAAWAAAGECLLDRRHPAEAEAFFDRLLARDPADPTARLGKARCRRELGDPAAASDVLDKLLFARPDDPAALAERGQCDLQAGRPADAADRLKRAAELRPLEPNAVFGLALAQEQAGRPAEAAATRQRLAGLEADKEELHRLLTAVAADPRNPDPRHKAGVLLLRHREVVEGRRWLESALAEDPAHAPSRQALAELMGRRGPKS